MEDFCATILTEVILSDVSSLLSTEKLALFLFHSPLLNFHS